MGLFFSFLSAVLSSSKDLVSKRLAFRLDSTASTYASFAYALPFYMIALIAMSLFGWETVTLSASFWLLVLLRSITDTMAEWLKMHAFEHGDISIVASFFSLSPLFLLITSPLITGDQLAPLGALALVIVVIGSLLLVYRPTSHGWRRQKKAIFLAIAAAIFFSLNSCFDRLAVQEGNPVFAGFTMTLLSALFLFPLIIRSRPRLESLRAQRTGLLIRAVLEFTFMSSKLIALQYLTATDVVGIQRLALVFSIVGGYVFFKEEDLPRRLSAGILILAGVFLITWLQLT
ncbi:MAG: hypothetical protein KatS3mg105_1838 [Gemmatales bacterium]|nr:MAG: hypothetical protein KatS3mg105_1838 [Gemmatales bacterium]